ncbi:protein D3-like [Schistocerca americana]|uniref:protein D3-like n=1 Tax=Schistocerca americana TaxID=7009 RepID=UPI001F4F94DA|nr:protein D3-like [Schistocerca americana]
MRGVLFGAFSLFLCVSCSADTLDYVPDVVPQEPSSVLNVHYGKHAVENGNQLTPTDVKDHPSVTWDAEKDTYYTLAMTDPDAPSRKDPKFREFLHWLVVNIPGNDIAKGETLAEYVGSGPPRGTGLHRYVFLVFKQPGKLDFDEEPTSRTSRIGRPRFSIHKFIQKYNMEEPAVGGNYYQAQYDDYVPVIQRQLSG